jgi:hypothetical protein
VYALQVQAFLDAADEVDIDEDITADILRDFDGNLHNDEDGEVNVDVDGEPNVGIAMGGQDGEDKDWESEDDDASSELDVLEEEGEGVVVLVAHKCVWMHRVYEEPNFKKLNDCGFLACFRPIRPIK